MLESENMTGLAFVLICFDIFFNNLLDEDLENIVTGLESLEDLLFNQLYIIINTYLFLLLLLTSKNLLKLGGGKLI